MSNKEINREVKNKLYEKAKEIMHGVLEKESNLTSLRQNNWVFITERQNRNYMVKFVPEPEATRLRVEVGIARMLKEKTDIPIPEVLQFGPWDKYLYLFREIIEGETLIEAVKRRNHRETLFYQAGEALAKIHRIEFQEKGILNQNMEVESAGIFNRREFMGFVEKLQQYNVVCEKEVEVLSNLDIDAYYPSGNNVLCHGDYSLSNLIAKENTLAGLIDFEWAMAAPPWDDIASFDVFLELEGLEENTQAYYKGYQSIRKIDDFYFENINLYKLYRLATMVSYQIAAKDEQFDEDRLALMKKKLKESIPML